MRQPFSDGAGSLRQFLGPNGTETLVTRRDLWSNNTIFARSGRAVTGSIT